jgi:molecular chaperone GrpE
MKKENSKTVEDKNIEDKKQKENSSKENSKKEKSSKNSQSKTEAEPIPESETIDEKASDEQSEGNVKSNEDKLNEEIKAQKDKYLRLFAEFENYKRRTSKERLELFKTASQDLMQVMLPVLDDFDRALKEIRKSDEKSLVEGVELINNKLRETLKLKGLEPMAVNPGDAFDADLHEAVTQIPAPDKSMKGKIVDVVEKGYTLGEKIIRFPKVVTGK